MIQEFQKVINGCVFIKNDINDGEGKEGKRIGLTKYEEAKKIWNGMYSHINPSVIVQCKSEQDILECLNFYRSNGKQFQSLTVKSGGHSIAGQCISENGFCIDLSLMKNIEVNQSDGTVWVECGCLLGDVDKATQKHGWVVPSGLASHTGITGLTLGGGIGWLSRTFGLTCDNLIAAKVALFPHDDEASSQNEKQDNTHKMAKIILATETNENKDLLWALRGSGLGSAFGTVTSLQFKCFHVQSVFELYVVFKLSKDILTKYFLQWIPQCNNEMTMYAFIEDPYMVFIVICPNYEVPNLQTDSSTREKVNKLKNDILSSNPIYSKINEAKDYCTLQSQFDSAVPHGKWYYWKSSFVYDMSPSIIDAIMTTIGETKDFKTKSPLPIRHSIEVMHLGGRISETNPDHSSFTHRMAKFEIHTISVWEGSKETAKTNQSTMQTVLDWTHRYSQRMKQCNCTVSGYYNFYTPPSLYQQVKPGKIPQNQIENHDFDDLHPMYNQKDALRRIKKKYDPQNIFHNSKFPFV